jgi:hypothetical protein
MSNLDFKPQVDWFQRGEKIDDQTKIRPQQIQHFFTKMPPTSLVPLTG